MDGLLVALQPVLSKRQQHAILVIMTVEKRADVDVEGQVLSHQAELGGCSVGALPRKLTYRRSDP